MNRKPPTGVLRTLRKEVGFGCPVPGCGRPYLYWHHFDPPWRIRNHHNPNGMIALCSEHHDKADAGAYTSEQLHEFKRKAAGRGEIRGRFEWMRHSLLTVVGGNFFYETPVIFEFRGEKSIWISRDENDYLMLNVRMLSASGESRMRIEDNFWLTRGEPDDLESPPSGKLLHVKYANGDMLRVEFFELASVAATQKRYPETLPGHWGVSFPITAVEVHNKVGGTNIEFGPLQTKLPGVTITGSFASHCAVGIAIG